MVVTEKNIDEKVSFSRQRDFFHLTVPFKLVNTNVEFTRRESVGVERQAYKLCGLVTTFRMNDCPQDLTIRHNKGKFNCTFNMAIVIVCCNMILA
jgi:hypothetical protein